MVNSKSIVEDIVDFDQMEVCITYKFWDSKDKKIYEVKNISYDDKGIHKIFMVKTAEGNVVKTTKNGVIIPSTTIWDASADGGREIYMGDIVICDFLSGDYKERVVIWDNGWRVLGATTAEFKMFAGKFVKVVGNIWENEAIYKVYKEKFRDALKK